MATVKYFYIEDDTGALLGANGTALTAALAAMAGLVSEVKFAIPTLPLWLYFLGLATAFVSKYVISVFNNDVRERERSQFMRDFHSEAQSEGHASESDLAGLWARMEAHRMTLLSERMVILLTKARAYSFVASMICFLVATALVIAFIGSKMPSA